MPGGSGASGLVLAEPASRWSDLTLRVVSALVLLPVTLFCIWAGGYAFLLLVAVAGVVLASEWLAMCGYSSLDPLLVWFPICIVVVAISAGLGAAGTGLIVVLIGTVLAGVFHPRHGLASAPRGPGSALHQDPWSALHHALASGFRQGVGEAFHRARRDVGAGGPVEPGHDDGEASDRQGTAGTLRADHIGCAGQDIRGRTGHEDGKHDTSVGGPRCPRFHLAFGVPYIG